MDEENLNLSQSTQIHKSLVLEFCYPLYQGVELEKKCITFNEKNSSQNCTEKCSITEARQKLDDERNRSIQEMTSFSRNFYTKYKQTFKYVWH